MKDNNWNFDKTVSTDLDMDWKELLESYNDMQEAEADLYMVVEKLPKPEGLDKWKLKWRQYRHKADHSITFQHQKVYSWFQKLAYRLDLTVGEALHKWATQRNKIRQELELGETVKVEVNNLDSMDTSESKVSKQELQEMIENE